MAKATKRRRMSKAARAAVSARMKKYWAGERVERANGRSTAADTGGAAGAKAPESAPKSIAQRLAFVQSEVTDILRLLR